MDNSQLKVAFRWLEDRKFRSLGYPPYIDGVQWHGYRKEWPSGDYTFMLNMGIGSNGEVKGTLRKYGSRGQDTFAVDAITEFSGGVSELGDIYQQVENALEELGYKAPKERITVTVTRDGGDVTFKAGKSHRFTLFNVPDEDVEPRIRSMLSNKFDIEGIEYTEPIQPPREQAEQSLD